MNKWFQECSLAKQKGVGGGGRGGGTSFKGESFNNKCTFFLSGHFIRI